MKNYLFLFFTIISNNYCYSQVNLNSGLMGYFPLNGNADDLSSLNINGINNGASPDAGLDNNSSTAMLFDENQPDYITADTSGRSITNVVTISAWIKTTTTGTDHIVTKYNWSDDAGVYIAVFQNKAIIAGRDGSGQFIYPGLGTTTVNDGAWHHIVGVVNGNTWQLWVDCNLEASLTTTTSNPDLSTSEMLGIGYHPQGDSGDFRYFNGTIDEVRIYNRVLTPDEMGVLCNINTALGYGVSGFIYNDISQDCNRDATEPGLAGRLAVITPGNIMVQTDNSGMWFLDSLPAGSYTITFDTSGNWVPTCPTTASFSVLSSNGLTVAPSFGMVSTQPCTEPDVSIAAPFLRRCFTNQMIYVQACNDFSATGALNNGYVEVELDPLFTVTNSSLPYTSIGPDLYRVDIGTLNPGQCESFWLATTISCNAILGQTLCMEANLFPADSCVLDTIPADDPFDFTPCTLPWDQSSISVDGWCQNDSIYFTITNTGDPGDGDMECYSPVRLYIDGQYIWLDSIMLTGGDTDTLVFAGDGQAWRLEVDQHPLHPGNSHPNATVELCGNQNNWTPGLVTVLPPDDADPVIDIYCGPVTGSYDPNDKTGYPLGVTEDHYILPNGQLEYLIRFQNTGTDTAFTVVIRDTLDTDLNIFSVQSGASSHNYSFKIYGPRVLEWTFNNIMLPDSTTDNPGSNGFIKFTVMQIPNLADGTEINNTADIYFDFNAPVITNTTSHIIQRNIQQEEWTEQTTISVNACDSYSLNGMIYNQSGIYWQIIDGFSNPDTLLTLSLTINTADLTVIQNQHTLVAVQNNVTYQWIDCDDLLPVTGETNQSFTPESAGNYALVINQNGCVDTTACYFVSDVSVTEISSGSNFIAYPNPTSGKIMLVAGKELKDVSVNVTDMSGRIVLSKKYNNSAALEFEISGESGMYFIRIDSEAGPSVIRVIKE